MCIFVALLCWKCKNIGSGIVHYILVRYNQDPRIHWQRSCSHLKHCIGKCYSSGHALKYHWRDMFIFQCTFSCIPCAAWYFSNAILFSALPYQEQQLKAMVLTKHLMWHVTVLLNMAKLWVSHPPRHHLLQMVMPFIVLY